MTRVEELRWRLLGYRPTDRVVGWVGPLFFMLVGGFLRFWHLDRPHQLVFDETYYVKQGVSMLLHGVELRNSPSISKPDELFTSGTPDVFGTTGDLVVHPPVGKWVIAFGEWIFGADSSWGWRFSVALLGTVSILMIGRAARRMFRSSLMGTIAAFLMAFEGSHFVHSRTGLLDLILMFFVLAAFCCLLIDRDRSRERLAARMAALPERTWAQTGPWMGLRGWRIMAGVFLGLATGTKWSGLFVLAAFGLMSVWWDLGARRAVGIRRWALAGLFKDGPYAALSIVGAAFLTYLASWAGWFRSSLGYNRDWAALNPAERVSWLPDPLASLLHYHQEIYAFHVGLRDNHPYKTNPWSWIIQGRPTSFFYEGPKEGQDGCAVTSCSKAITSVGSVSVWWLGAVAIVVLLWWWLARRDWRAGAIVVGIAAGWLPWFQYQERTIYTFYSIAFQPFVILACVFVLGLILGQATDSARRRRIGLYVVGGYLLLTLAVFAFFWPVWTAQVIPYSHWRARMWFPSWI